MFEIFSLEETSREDENHLLKFEVFAEDVQMNKCDIQGFKATSFYDRNLQRKTKYPSNNQQSKNPEFFNFKYTTKVEFCTIAQEKKINLIKSIDPQNLVYSNNNSIRIYNSLTTESISIISPHNPSFLRTAIDGEIFGNSRFITSIDGSNRVEILKLNEKPEFEYFSFLTENTSFQQVQSCLNENGKSILLTDKFNLIRFDLEKKNQNLLFESKDELKFSSYSMITHRKHLVGTTNNEIILLDEKSSQCIWKRNENSISACFHPDGIYFCIGTHSGKLGDVGSMVKIFDCRFLTDCLSSIECLDPLLLKYSPNGEYLSIGDSNDFVSILHTKYHQYNCRQIIDFFGKLSGLDFEGEKDCLFFGISCVDEINGAGSGIVEYEKVVLGKERFESKFI